MNKISITASFLFGCITTIFGASMDDLPSVSPGQAYMYYLNKADEDNYRKIEVSKLSEHGRDELMRRCMILALSKREMFPGHPATKTHAFFEAVPQSTVVYEDVATKFISSMFPWSVDQLAKSKGMPIKTYLGNFDNLQEYTASLILRSTGPIKRNYIVRRLQYEQQVSMDIDIYKVTMHQIDQSFYAVCRALGNKEDTLTLQEKNPALDRLWNETTPLRPSVIVQCVLQNWMAMLLKA